MAITQLARKGRVNKVRATKRKQLLKLLTATPVIKNIDVEAIKKEFEAKKAASLKPASKKKVEEATSTEEK